MHTLNHVVTHTLICECVCKFYCFTPLFLLLRVTSLTRLPSALVDLSEPLQVIRYEHGDFSNAHHDSSPSHTETTCAHTRLAGNTSALTEVFCRYVWHILYFIFRDFCNAYSVIFFHYCLYLSLPFSFFQVSYSVILPQLCRGRW